jgi:hypothetical protein
MKNVKKGAKSIIQMPPNENGEPLEVDPIKKVSIEVIDDNDDNQEANLWCIDPRSGNSC